MDELEGIKGRAISIPPLPKVVTKLQELVANAESTIAQVVEVVESDPGLATRCLRVANSSIYGLRKPAASLRHAASVLGMRAIRDMALQTSVVRAYEHLRAYKRFDLDLFWKHSALTAAAARRLARSARALGSIDVDAIAACGLLHNLGRLAMLEAFKKEYLDVIVPVGSFGSPALQAERDAFAFDHGAAGAYLAKEWNLSPDMIAAARDHHLLVSEAPPMAVLVGLANHLAHAALERGEAGIVATLASPAVKRIGLPTESHPDLVEALLAGVRETANT